MANTNSSKTSFVQYAECQLCRIHHNFGNKHLYSNNHQKNLKLVLKKCLMKVSEGKKSMKAPEVHDLNWEKDQKFWCYFCMKEFAKHLVSNDLMITNLGLIHHLADHQHYENVKKFFKKNRLQTQKPEKYIIKKSDLLSFLDALPASEARYLQKMDDIHKKQVSEMCAIEKQRIDWLSQVNSETSATSATEAHNLNITESQVKKSVTNLKKNNLVSETKIPPWLLPAHVTSYDMLSSSSEIQQQPSATNSTTTVGPSMEDFLAYVKQQEKKKLNPNRVGATFDRSVPTTSAWLPAFSKITNTSSRKNSAYHFLAQKRKRQASWKKKSDL